MNLREFISGVYPPPRSQYEPKPATRKACCNAAQAPIQAKLFIYMLSTIALTSARQFLSWTITRLLKISGNHSLCDINAQLIIRKPRNHCTPILSQLGINNSAYSLRPNWDAVRQQPVAAQIGDR